MQWDKHPRNVLRDIYEDDFGAALRDISLTGLSSLILKTPVDTGRLRGGWFVTIGTPSEGSTINIDKQGGATIGLGRAVIDNAEIGDVVILQNNVEYGIFINDGTDRIAPRRMVERTIDELTGAFG